MKKTAAILLLLAFPISCRESDNSTINGGIVGTWRSVCEKNQDQIQAVESFYRELSFSSDGKGRLVVYAFKGVGCLTRFTEKELEQYLDIEPGYPSSDVYKPEGREDDSWSFALGSKLKDGTQEINIGDGPDSSHNRVTFTTYKIDGNGLIMSSVCYLYEVYEGFCSRRDGNSPENRANNFEGLKPEFYKNNAGQGFRISR